MDQPMMPPAPQPKKRKTWLWVLLGILGAAVILVGIFVWWLFGGSAGNAKGVAEDWLGLLKTGQVTEAYDMTATAFKEGTSAEQFQVFLDAYPIMTSFESVNFDSIERQAGGGQDLTTLQGTLTDADEAQSPIEMVLIQEDSDWRVYNVDLRGL